MAWLQRLSPFSAFSRVKDGLPTKGQALFLTERETAPVAREGTPPTRRIRMRERARETHTVTQAAATRSSRSTRTGAGPLMCGS